MKLSLAILLAISGLNTGFAQPVPELKFWMERVAQIHAGMRREEVERILPPQVPPQGGGFTDTSQGITYTVAPGYTVYVQYDYTGVPRDANGKTLGYYSPDNILLAPVKLRPAGFSELRQVMLAELASALATKEARLIADTRMEFEMLQPWANIEKGSRASRDAKFQLLLAALQKVDEADDKSFDPNDPNTITYMNMMPRPRTGGIPEGYVSGMAPESIKDPVVRAEYKRAIALNAAKAARNAPRSALYAARMDWVRAAAYFCRNQYDSGIDDRDTVNRLVAAELKSAALKKVLADLVATGW